ncbi:MAG: chemotaxis protein CheE [Alphaproteobacteria bacterium]|nr:chemotaxis protein CheE [Alphaproteobacteria bacterium]MBU2380471.1 chemotaxis protein CheE [Alphaproteobacteria bacterium]
MSAVIWRPRKSRLSKLIDQSGGLSVGIALKQAATELKALEAESRAIVAARIADLSALVPPESDEPRGERLEQAYGLSSAVIQAAGPFNRDDLCAAAAGLCDLIDAAEPGKPFDWRIVTVHAQALKLILSLPDDAAEARAEVLNGLSQVLARKRPLAETAPD